MRKWCLPYDAWNSIILGMKNYVANGVVVVALALMVGCATKEMKSTPFYEGDEVTYTGQPEDRVNLWPVAYWREPVGSVLWPLTSFSDDHFALRPIYSQYKQDGKDGAFDEYSLLWPLCQADTKHKDYRVFPFFWGKDYADRDYQTLFPIYWNGHNYNSLFPLWIYRGTKDDFDSLAVLFGLAGASDTSNWCFPLWYWNDAGTFMTTLYGKWKSGWALPLLFSWGERRENGNWNARFLLGLGGAERYNSRLEHWAFPFYSREESNYNDYHMKMSLLLNLVGWNGNYKVQSSHVFPLYGWKRDDHLVTPLFLWEKDGTFLTWLGGRTVSGGTTNVYVTPLVRGTYGDKTGTMVFPLWSHKADRDFAAKAKRLDADRLPDDIRVWMGTHTNLVWNEKTKTHDEKVVKRRCADRFGAYDETDWLVFLSWNDRVHGALGWFSSTNNYEMTRIIRRGHGLLLHYEYEREVVFSATDRSKQSDKEETELSFLLWLYNYESETDRMKSESYTRHRVLWRLWDWEQQNGDVSLDVFPGFTYDSKTNGYSKTSLLWRLFRYEKDPQRGTSLDFFFIPLARP